MRAAAFSVAALTTSLVLLAACGASAPPPAQAGVAPAVVAADPAAGGAAAVVATPGATPDPSAASAAAGPTTTTTQTLGPAGAGTKLTPAAPGDAPAADKHHGEPGRTLADLRAIVNARRDDARACYDSALAAHPSIEGTIDVRWTIDPSGKVTDADIDTSHSELVEPAVANCIIAIIKGIKFNASAKGFETKAHYPFNFHPHGKHVVNTAP